MIDFSVGRSVAGVGRTTRVLLLLGATVALLAVVVAVFLLERSRPIAPARAPALARATARTAVVERRRSRDPEPAPERPAVVRRAAERPRAAPRPVTTVRPMVTSPVDRSEAPPADPGTDAAARAQFDAAFELEPRDEAWATSTEAAIDALLAGTEDTPRVEVSCRATLCRVELPGGRVELPSVPPLDGVTWWIGDREGPATLLLVRDDADIPLPTDPDA